MRELGYFDLEFPSLFGVFFSTCSVVKVRWTRTDFWDLSLSPFTQEAVAS